VASKLYDEYLVVSRPEYDEMARAWFVNVSISWQADGHLQMHKFNPTKPFESQKAAVDEGFRLADLWIHQGL
jgi:hypothetical protein